LVTSYFQPGWGGGNERRIAGSPWGGVLRFSRGVGPKPHVPGGLHNKTKKRESGTGKGGGGPQGGRNQPAGKTRSTHRGSGSSFSGAVAVIQKAEKGNSAWEKRRARTGGVRNNTTIHVGACSESPSDGGGTSIHGKGGNRKFRGGKNGVG